MQICEFFRSGMLMLLLLQSIGQISANITLPRLISDGIVLQRDTEIKVWGWADPGETITISFLKQEYYTNTDSEGAWEIILPPIKAGGPYKMKLMGEDTIVVKDILIGDLWICAGQSNMQTPMSRVEIEFPGEIAKAIYPQIRYFRVPEKYNFKGPQPDLSGGTWKQVDPEMVPNMAGVPYYFAKNLYEKYKVPIGLINASLGGSPIEAWMSEEALMDFPEHLDKAIQLRDDNLVAKIIADDRARMGQWYSESWNKDKGYANQDLTWRQADFDDTDWPVMEVPGYWADTETGEVNGVVWFRRKITVPESMTGKPAMLILGRIWDADSVFVNGQFVGATGYTYPPRRYHIPDNILKEGENTISVRVISNIGRGGFIPDKSYELVAGSETIDLQGEWKYRVGVEMQPLQPETFIRWKPTGLYNAMIAPLLNLSIRGITWYQGEGNTHNPSEYALLFPAMIRDWRLKWDQGSKPFLFVQLHNFMKSVDFPQESNWAEVRQVQLDALSIENTGMAVAIDLGVWNDIHPLNKIDVGKRLSLIAQHLVYDEGDVVFSGPVYKTMKLNGNKVIINFSDTGSGLVFRGDGKHSQFAIAGVDGKYTWAKVKLKGDKIIVWSNEIIDPVSVRYAWADNPDGILLYNKEGLPASPFTTE